MDGAHRICADRSLLLSDLRFTRPLRLFYTAPRMALPKQHG